MEDVLLRTAGDCVTVARAIDRAKGIGESATVRSTATIVTVAPLLKSSLRCVEHAEGDAARDSDH